MITRRQFLKATSTLGAGLAVSGPARGRAQKLEPFHMACWSNKISEQANIYAAEEFGWFKAEGIDFEFKPGQGGGDALKHVLAGNADIAMANVEAMLFAMEQGAKLVSVYDVYPQNVFNVVSLKKSNVTKPADLKGKRRLLTFDERAVRREMQGRRADFLKRAGLQVPHRWPIV
jgi:ABC-type nitrate/sulfonate/bicarbonate transport system substrate-binding protein